jgi:group I intron endonuclease
MSCGIYKIENQINQKVYIGQSTNISTRWRRHRSEANNLNNSYPLYCAMRKYGLENFSFEIIEECPREKLNEKEKYWISFFKS